MNAEIENIGFYKNISTPTDQSLVHVAEAKANAEVQAQYVIAKKFPRDEHSAYLKIIKTCERPYLAEQSMYAFPRGNQTVKGASIRLAEAIAQAWGNIDCGVKEISQSNGVSIAEAYAIDLETNIKITKIFHVPHVRETKRGKDLITNSRDIYEIVANQGARRLRACILGIIPGDIIEAALEQCSKTLKSSSIPMEDRIRKMVVAFNEVGVKKEHIESKLGHSLSSIIPDELLNLQAIYKSIRDGISNRNDFFDINKKEEEVVNETKESQVDKLKQFIGINNNENFNDDINDDNHQDKISEIL